jgi:hypothetical protein
MKSRASAAASISGIAYSLKQSAVAASLAAAILSGMLRVKAVATAQDAPYSGLCA